MILIQPEELYEWYQTGTILMPNMTNVNSTSHYVMLKGEPGTRKSSQAVTWPTPQYWFSFDRKMKSLIIPMGLYNIKPEDIHFDLYDDWMKAEQKFKEFLLSCPYKTIVVDSVTSCADAMLRQALHLKTGATRSSGRKAGMTIGGIEVNELVDYNAEAAGLNQFMDLTQTIQLTHGVNVVLIAHVLRRDTKDPNGMTQVTRTLLTAGKGPAAKIPIYLEEVYHLGFEASPDPTVGGDLVVLTQNTADDYARTTLPLPLKINLKNDNLYQKHIQPAIEQQQKLKGQSQ